jgi:hypothetical protein
MKFNYIRPLNKKCINTIEERASVNALTYGNQTKCGHSETAELSIKNGAFVNAHTIIVNQTPLYRTATGNRTPLHWNVQRGDSKQAEEGA